jgi:outer membrane protein OmpA-like peptidoglycan-associated protein
MSPAAQADEPLKKQRHLFELGVFGGVWIPPDGHGLFEEPKPHQPLKKLGPEFGLRVGYLPLPYLGVEAEAGVIPTATDDSGDPVTVMAFRGHLLGQYPAWIAPFLVAGAGVLQTRSGVLGDDTDMAFHWGGGLKLYVTRWLALRVEGRHTLAPKRDDKLGHTIEALGGFTFVVGWSEAPKDRDGDGVLNEKDRCPDEPAKTPDGCPVKDHDGDGVLDDKDKCPTVFAKTENGCPPDSDGDGVTDDKDRCPKAPAKTPDGCPDTDEDGVPDDRDKCPEVAAKTPDGCPPDRDGDGIVDSEDQCPDEPETKNGFKDADGCPDTLPRSVKRFTGTIRGITFATGKAKIRRRSFRTLKKAVEVLKKYEALKLIIRGHTDNRGKRERNMELSLQRAQAVKDYLVKEGIDEGRLKVQGLGPDEPIADNKKRRGRAKNRRIEFKLDMQ